MADKVQIMLELESRGALPADKKAILDELRSRGAIPSSASAPAKIGQYYPDQNQNERLLPSFIKPGRIDERSKAGLTPVPEWKQTAMKGVNALPELGGAVGAAAGMAAAIPEFVPSGGASALQIPVAGAAGRTIGKEGQSLLTGLLLPEAVPPKLTARDVTTGASNAMLDALLMGKSNLIMNPSAAERTINPSDTISAKARDYMNKRLLNPSMKNPEEARGVIKNVGEMGIDVAHGEGPAKIQNSIRDLSGKVDELISTAERNGETISKDSLMQPLMQMRSMFEQGDMPKYVRQVDAYINGFNKMHPQNELAPTAAQDLKKFIYQTINKGWGENTYTPVTEAKKTLSGALASGIENAAPEVGPINTELGKLIEMRPYVTKASEAIQEMPIHKRGLAHVKQGIANAAEKVNRGLRSSPDIAPDISSIGAPKEVQSLEALFGPIKYGTNQQITSTPIAAKPYQEPLGLPAPEGPKALPSTGVIVPEAPAPRPLLPETTRVNPNAVIQMGHPNVGEYGPSTENLISAATPPKGGGQLKLPAPGVKGTPTGANLTNEDLRKLEAIYQMNPADAQILRKLLGMD